MIQRTTTPGLVEYRDSTDGAVSVATYPEPATAAPLALLGSGELSAILAGTLTVVTDPLGIWSDPDDPTARVPDAYRFDAAARAALVDEASAIVARESEPPAIGARVPALIATAPPRIGGYLPFGRGAGGAQ